MSYRENLAAGLNSIGQQGISEVRNYHSLQRSQHFYSLILTRSYHVPTVHKGSNLVKYFYLIILIKRYLLSDLTIPVHWQRQGCRGPDPAEREQDLQHRVLYSGPGPSLSFCQLLFMSLNIERSSGLVYLLSSVTINERER